MARGIATSIKHDYALSKRSGEPLLEERIPYSKDGVVMTISAQPIDNNSLLSNFLFAEFSVCNGDERIVLEGEPA
jgi:hypothetical protein